MNNLIGISGKIGSGKDTVGKILQYLSVDKSNFREAMWSKEAYFIKQNNQALEYLNSKSNYQIKKYADKLKDIVCLLIGCTREQLEDREFKEKELSEEWWYFYDNGHKWDKTLKPIYKPYLRNESLSSMKSSYSIVKLTPRKLLQLLGTECGREILHPNIWVNALFADYKPVGKSVGTLPKDNTVNLYHSTQFPNWIITDVRFPNEAKAIKDRGGVVIRVNRPVLNDLKDDTVTAMAYALSIQAKQRKKGIYHPSETALDDYEFDHVIENDGSIEELVKKVKQLNLV